MIIRFYLVRTTDVTGISGTGIVAEGVRFSDGTVAMRWLETKGPHYERGVRATTVLHESLKSVEALHGHGGATQISLLTDGLVVFDNHKQLDLVGYPNRILDAEGDEFTVIGTGEDSDDEPYLIGADGMFHSLDTAVYPVVVLS